MLGRLASQYTNGVQCTGYRRGQRNIYCQCAASYLPHLPFMAASVQRLALDCNIISVRAFSRQSIKCRSFLALPSGPYAPSTPPRITRFGNRSSLIRATELAKYVYPPSTYTPSVVWTLSQPVLASASTEDSTWWSLRRFLFHPT